MKIRFFLLTVLTLVATCVSAENYFRPGTVWTILSTGYTAGSSLPSDRIVYKEILDEITINNEKVLPLIGYSDERDLEKNHEIYIKTDGDKVYWKPVQPEDSEWYLMYDFGLQPDEEVVIYEYHNKDIVACKLKCLERDFYLNDDPLMGPMMRMQTLTYKDMDFSEDDNQGNWIIGIGSEEYILHPGMFGWVGGGESVICVESPKGNVVFGNPEASINSITSDSKLSTADEGVFNLNGIRITDSIDSLPVGIYVVDGKKRVIK